MTDPQRIQLFCDESGIDGDSHHLAIGMLWTNRQTRETLHRIITGIRAQEGFHNEIHFVKLSPLRLRVYRRLIEETLPHIRYRMILVRRSDVDLRRFSNQRYKMLNYFTRQMVGHHVQPRANALLYLDFKVREKHDNGLEYLFREVNRQQPGSLKAVEILDSRRSEMMQISDLYLGLLRHGHVMGWPLQRCKDAQPPAETRKDELYCDFVRQVYGRGARQQFDIWAWRPNARRAGS